MPSYWPSYELMSCHSWRARDAHAMCMRPYPSHTLLPRHVHVNSSLPLPHVAGEALVTAEARADLGEDDLSAIAARLLSILRLPPEVDPQLVASGHYVIVGIDKPAAVPRDSGASEHRSSARGK